MITFSVILLPEDYRLSLQWTRGTIAGDQYYLTGYLTVPA